MNEQARAFYIRGYTLGGQLFKELMEHADGALKALIEETKGDPDSSGQLWEGVCFALIDSFTAIGVMTTNGQKIEPSENYGA